MTARPIPVLAITLLAFSGLSQTALRSEPITDPSKAGADFRVQGEYIGEIDGKEGHLKIGVQVVALGKGEFEGRIFQGGLPGDRWNRGDRSEAIKGKTADGATTLSGEHLTAKIKDGSLTILNASGKALGELKRVERKSPTLGAKPPKDAVVLFDGSTADGWNNGKLVEGDLLNCGVTSKKTFNDCTLHVEFRCPYMPEARGQARGNSGVYLQSRYEAQVLDSFGGEGKDDDCGGIYKVAEPKVNMCLPPLSWQSYDIDFTAARYDASGKKTANAQMTVKHNGVLIHDNVEVPHTTTAAPIPDEKPGPAPLYLQDHGTPVVYRNVWVVEKK